MSRSEELVLLAVWKLGTDSSCLPIRDCLAELTGKSWSLGSVFDPLERLERKGYLRSSFSEPDRARCGRSKRVYRITPYGKRALAEIRELERAMWAGVPDPETEAA